MKLLIALVVVYFVLLILAVLVSERAIFLPPPPSYVSGGDVMELTTRDGVGIAALHLPAPPDVEDPFTLLYSHGNAEDLGHARPWLEALRAMGFAVLAYDYRGYGASDPVRTTERGVYRDMDAAYDHLTGELGVSPDRVILFGRSVGAGPTLELAVRREAAGIILDSPFTSAFRVVTRIPLFPFDRFPNLRRLSRGSAQPSLDRTRIARRQRPRYDDPPGALSRVHRHGGELREPAEGAHERAVDQDP